jgi:hypothetical protein
MERVYGDKVIMEPVIYTPPGKTEPELRGVAPVYRDTADIAKDVRADIKAAVKAGTLPGAPVTYSVQTRKFAGGSAIDVTIKGLTDAFIYDPEPNEYGNRQHTPACKALLAQVKAIRDAYNYNGSDPMTDYFDVNFYGSVTVEDERTARFWAGEKAKKAAQKKLKSVPTLKVKRDKAGPGYVAGIVTAGETVLGRIVSKDTYGAPWLAYPADGGVTEVRGSQAEAMFALLDAATD